jgi:hypothetical protein
VPITSFLLNGPKKNAVTTAIAIKFDYTYLDELSRQMQILKRNSYPNVTQTDSFINLLNVERAEPIPPHESVGQLGKKVEDF